MKSSPPLDLSSCKKIIFCEDHHLIVAGLTSLLEESKKYKVIGSTANGSYLEQLLKKELPDILILDLNIPGKNGIEILEDLAVQYPSLNIVVLTMYNDLTLIEKVEELGAKAYLLKNTSNEEFLSTMEAINELTFYRGTGVKKRNTELVFKSDKNFIKKIKLTSRERQIIEALIANLTAEEISKKLNISVHTLRTHKKNIFKKLDIHNLVELVHFAYENQLV